jgi:hypothetical protein
VVNADTVLLGPLAGLVRGHTHSELEDAQGATVMKIDARDGDADIYGIGRDRAGLRSACLLQLRANQSPAIEFPRIAGG